VEVGRGGAVVYIDPEVWRDLEMRRALAVRDISTVYGLLAEHGVSQTDIARLARQSQSEVSEIISGRRVMAYDVLVRIAEGLGVPRGYMGLAQSDGPDSTYPSEDGGIDPEVDDEMISRRILGMASAALLGEIALDGPIMQLGTTVLGDSSGLQLLTGSSESLGTLDKHDVAWIKSVTDRLWSLDLEYGGASIFPAARGVAVQVVGALRNSPPSRELQLAASHLCRVAGWAAFDAGHKRVFWQYHATALDLAHEARDLETVITMVNVAGRAEILSGNHQAAAKLFELVSFRKKPNAVDWGLLGSSYAPHIPDSARGALEHLQNADGADTLDAIAMLGHVSHDLGDYPAAIDALNNVVPHRSGRLALQETVPLAIACLRTGERSIGLHHAENVLKMSENVRTSKCIDDLRPLGSVLATQPDSTAQDLARRMIAVAAT
jgi:transcriptional regulator with XRE-family HTH domain